MTVRQRAIYVAPETTYATEPSADGSGYSWVPATNIGDLKSDKGPIPMNYHTGRNYPRTGHIVGVDGGELDISVPHIGLATAAGNGASPPAIDWLGVLLRTVLGAPTAVDGLQITSLAGAALDTGTDGFDVQDLIVLAESGLPSSAPRAVPSVVTVDNADGTYTVSPAPGVAFTGSAVAYGYDRYRPTGEDTSTFSMTYVFNGSTQYTLHGCKVSGFDLAISGKGALELKLKIKFDGVSVTTKASLPAVSNGPAVTPHIAPQCIVYLDGVAVDSKATNLAIKPDTMEDESHRGVNGRAGFRQLSADASVSIEPRWQAGLREAVRNENGDTGVRSVLIQVGPGDPALGGGALNTTFYHFGRMIAEKADPSSDGNLQRQAVNFLLDDEVVTSGAASHPIQIFRC